MPVAESRGGGTGGEKQTTAGVDAAAALGRSCERAGSQQITGKVAGKLGDASKNSRAPWP
jgi:hypothetical protein